MSGVTIGAATAVAAGVAATAATVAAASSFNEAGKDQKKAATEQRRARQAQVRQQEIAQARERRNTVRTGRLARSSAIQAGVESGAGLDSSRVQGSTGSIQSQTAGNVSFLDTAAGLVETSNNALANAALFQSDANSSISSGNTFNAIAGMSSGVFSGAGGFGAFGGTPSTSTVPTPVLRPTS